MSARWIGRVQGRLRIVITGSTGFVGRQIIPILHSAGADLLLVGRDRSRMEALYPNLKCVTLEELGAFGRGYDILLHLAAKNNNQQGDLAEFRKANVDYAHTVQRAAKAAQIGKFVFVSTFHALDESRTDPYSVSKREAVEALRSEDDQLTVVYLPMVYGNRWAGKLSVLNALQPCAANRLFAPIAALKPVVHAEKIASFVLSGAQTSGTRDVCLFDDKDCNPFYRGVRRCGDLAAGLMIVCLLWWLYVPIWVFIRLQSHGPGVFAQARVGQDGKSFTCYKFRTMKVGTPQMGTHQVNPSSITAIGSFLRRWKFDELPQVINLFRGDMTLVGPRPCLPEQADVCIARNEAGVDVLRPGITGFSQVHDIDMSNPVRLALSDARYRATRGLILDLAIVLSTLGGKGRSDRVRISVDQPVSL